MINGEGCGSHCPCMSQDGPTKKQEKTQVGQATSWRRIRNWTFENGKNSSLSTVIFFSTKVATALKKNCSKVHFDAPGCGETRLISRRTVRLKPTQAQTNKSCFYSRVINKCPSLCPILAQFSSVRPFCTYHSARRNHSLASKAKGSERQDLYFTALYVIPGMVCNSAQDSLIFAFR